MTTVAQERELAIARHKAVLGELKGLRGQLVLDLNTRIDQVRADLDTLERARKEDETQP